MEMDDYMPMLREELVTGPLRDLETVRQELAAGSSLTTVLPRLNSVAAEVRNISHGVFPVALAQCGLRAALPQATVPDRRYPQIVEMTAYLAAGTEAGPCIVETGSADGPGLQIETPQPPSRLVRDRVSALGGQVTDTGVGWTVTVPIASR